MGLIHYRKGPNKVFFVGVTQPISDALKLLTKEVVKLREVKLVFFWLGPIISIFLMFLAWLLYDFSFVSFPLVLKVLFIISVIGLSSYGFILTSWGSNSKYSLIGGYRAVAQIISYEVCLMIFVIFIVYLSGTYSVSVFKVCQEGLWICFFSLVFFFCWFFVCLAESNRTPFDLAEGESEIVSGFNIEYRGRLFALIFIREYGIIIVIGFFTSFMFVGGRNLLLKTFFFSVLFVWIRRSFPRLRYDFIMFVCWKILLPYSISILMVSLAFY